MLTNQESANPLSRRVGGGGLAMLDGPKRREGQGGEMVREGAASQRSSSNWCLCRSRKSSKKSSSSALLGEEMLAYAKECSSNTT